MSEIILHHYPLSLFAEKIRRILAYKQLPWRSVEQPIMAPKPELVPLTGGYRRIPVLQIGADVYCDSACIARRLEELRPEPACVPKDLAGVAGIVEDWGDHRLFAQAMPPSVVALLPQLPPDILVDRAAMSPAFSKEAIVRAAPHAFAQALLSLDRLEAQLREGPFLLGHAFSIADAACFHPLWFARNCPELSDAIDARPALAAWLARIEGFGPGEVEPMSAAEALEVARAAEPADVSGSAQATTGRFARGDSVAISADDYGIEECSGTVARIRTDQIAVVRTDPAVGRIAVHFPLAGYRIRRA